MARIEDLWPDAPLGPTGRPEDNRHDTVLMVKDAKDDDGPFREAASEASGAPPERAR